MDALRSAGRAIIRSPSVAKQSWTAGRHKKEVNAGRVNFFSYSSSLLSFSEEVSVTADTGSGPDNATHKPDKKAHRELPENWTDTREMILEGMTFNLRHLGMTLVDQPKGEDLSAAAVKRIVATAKASGKKPQKVAFKVSPQGIVLYENLSNKLLENVSIYRISYCTVDKLHDKVFAYIAQNTHNGTLECHAYLCSKRKVAQAVALTVAQAFTIAFELWQVTKEEKGKRVKSGSAGESSSSSHSERSNSLGSLKGTDVATDNLLDFEDSMHVAVETNGNVEEDQLDNHVASETNNNPAWEMEDGLDEAFSRLAVSRTNPQVLDIGVTPQDWLTEPDLENTSGNAPCGLSPFRDDIFAF